MSAKPSAGPSKHGVDRLLLVGNAGSKSGDHNEVFDLQHIDVKNVLP
jgi:hypothetical protein